MVGRAYLFFFLAAFFFAAILFSSQVSEFFRQIQTAERVFNSHV
jgi:hypothetical protein